MKSTHNKCVVCGGRMRIRPVELMRKREGKIYVFEDVPAKVCDECGQQFFSGDVLDQMDEIMKSDAQGIGKIEATVHAFPKQKEAA